MSGRKSKYRARKRMLASYPGLTAVQLENMIAIPDARPANGSPTQFEMGVPYIYPNGTCLISMPSDGHFNKIFLQEEEETKSRED